MSQRQRFEESMRKAEGLYAPEVNFLKSLGIESFVTQTGGMSLAIEIPLAQGYALVTGGEDPLCWDKENVGFACSAFDQEGQFVKDLVVAEGPVWTSEEPKYSTFEDFKQFALLLAKKLGELK